jgi:hypothetical protein
MVSIMPAFAAAKTVLFLLLLSLSAHAAEPFHIDKTEMTKSGNNYTLKATIAYQLSPIVIDALENGIPITFLQYFQLSQAIPIIEKYWPWRWRDSIWERILTYELRYHALSEQYILLTVDTHHQRSFPSLKTALTALGDIRDQPLSPAQSIDPATMTIEIHSELNINALPTPMRLGALLSDNWQVGSPWVVADWP